MSVAIRPAEQGDIASLVAADSFAQSNAGRRIEIAYWVENGQCFLAERDQRVVGYAVLTRNFFHSFFIELLMVQESVRRTGVGRALIEHVVALVPGGEKLWTSTNTSNTPMRRLLEGVGFIESGRIDNLDEDDPELVFVRLP
jgi:GNAT superfamily N-acetyltransferase